MAEWSMAVVLKTSGIWLYQDGIFSGLTSPEHARDVARFCAIFAILQSTLITDYQNFGAKSLI
jgi:hypothetical protein